MSGSHTCVVTVSLRFCDDEMEVQVYGTYHPYQRAYTPLGEYAPIDPPEPSSFEYSKITRNLPGGEVDITRIIPPLCESYITEMACQAYEEGGYGEPDPDMPRDLRAEGGR